MDTRVRSFSRTSLLSVAVAVAVLGMALVGQAATTIVEYNFDNSSAAPSFTAAHVTASAFGEGSGTLSFDTAFGSSKPSVFKLYSEILSLPETSYFSFSLTPQAGYGLDLDEVTFLGDFQKDKENPANPKVTVDVRASMTGTDFVSVGTLDLNANNGDFHGGSVDINGTSFGEVLSTIEFRLYLLMDPLAGFNLKDGIRVDNIELTGTVSPAQEPTAVPEPASLSLALLLGLGGVSLLCLQRRRGHA